jgi:hypothetical protein
VEDPPEADPEDGAPEAGVPEDGARAGEAVAGAPEVALAAGDDAPECETARKMAIPATTPMTAPNATRRVPRAAKRVKEPLTVVDLPTCPTPVP